MKKPKTSTMRSQWAGQFLTAGELARRGHLVAFPMGNAPALDILCQSPSDKPFAVQVKTTATAGHWQMHKAPRPNIYYVLVDVRKPDAPARYFILTGTQALKEWTAREEYHAQLIKERGPRKNLPCIMVKDAAMYEACWEVLPK